MQNKNQMASPFRWMLRRYLFLIVIVLLITFAVFPMQGMMRVVNQREYLDHLEFELSASEIYQMRQTLTMEFVYSPLNLEMLCALFGGMGFAAATVLFRHLFSRKQGMMYAALPITRTKDFLLRCGIYAVYCLIPMAICLVIHPVMVRTYRLWDLFDFGRYLQRAGATLLINLYGFALGTLCASLFGTVWSAAAGGLLMAGSAELLTVCWIRIAHMYLGTMHTATETRNLMRLSPVYTLYKAFYQPGHFSILPAVLAIAALLALSVLARRVWRPENAGHTLNLKKAEPFLLAWVTLLGGTAGAVVLSLYLGREIMLILGLILGALAAWILARMMTEQRIHLDLRAWKIPAAALCAMLLALVCLRTDALGFNTYAPKAESLRAVRVQPYQNENDEMSFETPESIAAALAWTDAARDNMLAMRAEEVYSGYGAGTLVIFEEKGGAAVTRQYDLPAASAELLPSLRIMAAEYAKEQSESIPETDTVTVYSALSTFGMSDYDFMTKFGFSPSEASRRFRSEDVREALRKDLAARTLEDMQEPGLLSVSFDGMILDEDGKPTYRYDAYQVTPSDRNTLELLLGGDAEKWIDYARGGFAENEEVLVFLCNYTLDGNGDRVIDSYTRVEDTEEVRQLMSQVTHSLGLFQWPMEEDRFLAVYSVAQMRERMEWDPDFQLDPEDPETLRTLPVTDATISRSYYFMSPEQ